MLPSSKGLAQHARCSPRSSRAAWGYRNELETPLKEVTCEQKGCAFNRRPYIILHSWVVKCLQTRFCKTSLRRSTQVAVGKEGQNRDTYFKSTGWISSRGLSQKLSCWRWMGDAISFPGWAEVSRLAECKPMNRANTFSASSSAHQESLTATPPSRSGSTFPSVSLKNYNWH